MTMVQAVSPMTCVFPLPKKTSAKGTLICFHPGGLSSAFYREFDKAMSHWNLVLVELQLNELYLNAYNKELNNLNHNIDEITQNIMTDLGDIKGQNLSFIGWSFGGVIAHKIACDIANARGTKLILLDSIAPVFDFNPGKKRSSHIIVKWFIEFLNALKDCQLSLPKIKIVENNYDDFLVGLLTETKRQGVFDDRTKMSGFKKLFTTFLGGMHKNSSLTTSFKPDKFLGDTLLIRASNGLFWRFKLLRTMGWKSITTVLETLTITTDHYRLVGDKKVIEQYINNIIKFIDG